MRILALILLVLYSYAMVQNLEHSFDGANLTPEQWEAHTYEIVFSDLRCFPVPLSTNDSTPDITFENDWMDPRTYGESRGHEGCDMMGDEMAAGFYPVVSITDGTVEKVGWLEKGGYRIGIRAPGGAYFYYAHLANYSDEWEIGENVHAGELLGFMGDTGYGPEGQTGQFPVHLHLGIYVNSDGHGDQAVNPYWVLQYLLQFRTSASY